jgi:hypothetical protein
MRRAERKKRGEAENGGAEVKLNAVNKATSRLDGFVAGIGEHLGPAERCAQRLGKRKGEMNEFTPFPIPPF